VKKSKVKEILEKFTKKYELSEELTLTLISNVDSYNIKNEEGEPEGLDLFDKKKKKENSEKEKEVTLKK
jgi:hypothetical protein